uniref:Ricin B lectin domain-containing protein n=1 Tax=Nothobranchius pienaari TaxID=704102 RepID=A0A1A8PTT7_9TELE
MGRQNLLSVCLLVFVTFKVSGFKIRNKLLGKCLQVQEGASGSRVLLGECSSSSPLQEWHWLADGFALRSQHTGECLTAPSQEYDGVLLQPCIFRSGVTVGGEASSQAWACSKKGHITLIGSGLHLSTTKESTLVFLLREHKQGSRWRTLDNQTVCDGRDSKQNQNQPSQHVEDLELETSSSHMTDIDTRGETFDGLIGSVGTEPDSGKDVPVPDSLSPRPPADPTMVFFTMDYGMSWKITMLVLSSLALVLGTVILILNVYSNRRKKVVCVLKSYTPRPDASVPGSPVPGERAPLTQHAMHLPHSSPTFQRGEILIEWKDGTVTPLYAA